MQIYNTSLRAYIYTHIYEIYNIILYNIMLSQYFLLLKHFIPSNGSLLKIMLANHRIDISDVKWSFKSPAV